ncbi:hypothetical protein ACWKWD_06565, partial [Kocuria rhizophila]
KHAASVRPEPGSNSPSKNSTETTHHAKRGTVGSQLTPNTPGNGKTPEKMLGLNQKYKTSGINKLDTLLS